MIGDLRVSYKTVLAVTNRHNSYVQMTASVNGTRFRMALKHIDPSSPKELASVSFTLFRIYKEALLHNYQITAQALKKQYLSSPPALLYETISRLNNDTFINIGKSVSYEQYQFQLKAIQQIPVFCQLNYGLPDISISALPDIFFSQLRDFFYCQQTIEKNDIKRQLHFIRSILLKEYQKGTIKLPLPLKEQLSNLHIPNQILTQDDIHKLLKAHLPQHLTTIRDAFIFSCHTGMSYKDITQLTSHNLRIVSDQSLWLFTNKNQYPLSSLPEYLKYMLLKKDTNIPLFNLPTIQYINMSLRIIAIKSNVKYGFTFKSAQIYHKRTLLPNKQS